MAAVTHQLEVDLVVALMPVEVPGPLVLVDIGEEGAEACEAVAGVEPEEGAGGVVAAERLPGVEVTLLARVAREGLDGAAKVEATPSEPAPEDRITWSTFSLVTARETLRPL